MLRLPLATPPLAVALIIFIAGVLGPRSLMFDLLTVGVVFLMSLWADDELGCLAVRDGLGDCCSRWNFAGSASRFCCSFAAPLERSTTFEEVECLSCVGR